jgi:hypothetical protein
MRRICANRRGVVRRQHPDGNLFRLTMTPAVCDCDARAPWRNCCFHRLPGRRIIRANRLGEREVTPFPSPREVIDASLVQVRGVRRACPRRRCVRRVRPSCSPARRVAVAQRGHRGPARAPVGDSLRQHRHRRRRGHRDFGASRNRPHRMERGAVQRQRRCGLHADHDAERDRRRQLLGTRRDGGQLRGERVAERKSRRRRAGRRRRNAGRVPVVRGDVRRRGRGGRWCHFHRHRRLGERHGAARPLVAASVGRVVGRSGHEHVRQLQ